MANYTNFYRDTNKNNDCLSICSSIFRLLILDDHLLFKRYNRVRKIRATHIMLDRRTTVIAFIECTNLHAATTRCQQSHKLSMPLQKSSKSSLFK